MNTVPTIVLNNDKTIPQLGFGTYQVTPDDAVETVLEALRVGYRHIDTAEMYGNEREVGEAIRQSGVDREDIFITSKLNNGFHKPDEARIAFDKTLQLLGVDYIDLFLIHWPLPDSYGGDFVSTWKTLEEFYKDGRAHSIGVSNFQVPHLERLAEECEVTPAVNQIEVHPYFQNKAVVEYCEAHGIVIEAWSPIAQGQILDDVVIGQIASEHDKSVAQVTLRWHIQKGYVVFPKSSTPRRIAENFEIFDFELFDGQMEQIDSLDKGEKGRVGPNPDQLNYNA